MSAEQHGSWKPWLDSITSSIHSFMSVLPV